MKSKNHKFKPIETGKIEILPTEFRPAGNFAVRTRANREYLMSLTNGNLLQNYLLEAGRFNATTFHWQATEGHHTGWESPTCQQRGHFLGHWLSAAARIYASRGDREIKAKADAIIAELAICQKDNGGEWIGAIPEKYLEWTATGKGVWAPHYNLHKLLMGLIEMHTLAGSEQALEVVENWAKWFHRWTGKLSREEMDKVLDCETGGMMEAWADLYGVTGKKEHLELVRRYERVRLFNALLEGTDVLTNQHANTTVPEVHGAARAYEVTGEERYRKITEAYWDLAVRKRDAFCTGGQTCGEIWIPPGMLYSYLSHRTQEHCVVYNMIRLADYLLRWTGDVEYAEYIERNLYNGILAQQNPRDAMVAYFLPLEPGAQKKWSTPTATFSCCQGTVVQAHATHTERAYYQNEEGLVITQYVPSKVSWEWKGRPVSLALETPAQCNGPRMYSQAYLEGNDPVTRPGSIVHTLRISCDKPVEFALSLRLPGWLAGKAGITVNGKAEKVSGKVPGYHEIRKKWKNDDSLRIEFPRKLTTCPLPDAPNVVAFMDGPVVLAGLVPDDVVLKGDPAKPEEILLPYGGRDWENWRTDYRTRGLEHNVRFVPLNEVVDERYTVYFPVEPAE